MLSNIVINSNIVWDYENPIFMFFSSKILFLQKKSNMLSHQARKSLSSPH